MPSKRCLHSCSLFLEVHNSQHHDFFQVGSDDGKSVYFLVGAWVLGKDQDQVSTTISKASNSMSLGVKCSHERFGSRSVSTHLYLLCGVFGQCTEGSWLKSSARRNWQTSSHTVQQGYSTSISSGPNMKISGASRAFTFDDIIGIILMRMNEWHISIFFQFNGAFFIHHVTQKLASHCYNFEPVQVNGKYYIAFHIQKNCICGATPHHQPL